MTSSRALRSQWVRRLAAALPAAWLATGCLVPGEPFLLEKDSTPPSLVAVEPGLSLTGPTTGVATTVTFEATFSERMSPESLAAGVTLGRNSTVIGLQINVPAPPEGASEEDLDVPSTVVMVPLTPLAGQTEYRLDFSALVSDSEGNPLGNPVTLQFTTGS